MLKKIFCLILILKLTQARYVFVPKFQGQDSAIIVDSDQFPPKNHNATVNYSNKIRIPPPFPLWRHYPRYHIIPPPPPGQILAINTWAKTANKKVVAIPNTTSTTTTSTTTSSTTTTTPKPTTTTSAPIINKSDTSYSFINDDEFPAELLDMAQSKLGLKSLDEIPSISELGQLLGTNSSAETLKYIEHLTSNEQGVALLKAYIESTDYTDNSGDLNNKDVYEEDEEEEEEKDEDDMGDIEEPVQVNDEGLIVINDEDSNNDYEQNNYEEEQTEETTSTKPTLRPRETPKIIHRLKELPNTHPSFMERIVSYMHLKNLFHKNKEASDSQKNKKGHQINRITVNGEKVKSQSLDQENQTKSEIINVQRKKSDNLKAPALVRESIPYNYPVPIRVPTTASTTSTTTTTSSPLSISMSSNTPVVHLNTPKVLIPHVKQLSRVTKIPSQNIEDFLASKPKLLELATKVSRLPIGYDRNSPMEAQVLAALQKAINQDQDLKKLLNSAATLK